MGQLWPTMPVLLVLMLLVLVMLQLLLLLVLIMLTLRLFYHRVDQGSGGHLGHGGMVERQYYEDAAVLLVGVNRWE